MQRRRKAPFWEKATFWTSLAGIATAAGGALAPDAKLKGPLIAIGTIIANVGSIVAAITGTRSGEEAKAVAHEVHERVTGSSLESARDEDA